MFVADFANLAAVAGQQMVKSIYGQKVKKTDDDP